MQTRKNHRWGQLFLLVLAVGTFYIIFRDNSIEDIAAALAAVKVRYVAVAVLMMAASILFQALALGAPFESFGRKVSLWRKIEYALAGFFFSAVTPSSTGGQPMQIYYMCRDNLRVSQISVSMLLANLAYQATVLLFGTGMFIAKYAYVTQSLKGFGALVFFGIAMNLLLMAAILFALFSERFASSAADRIVTLLTKVRIVKNEAAVHARVGAQMQEYKVCAAAVRARPSLFLRPMVYTFLQMLTYFCVPFFIYKAFSMQGATAFDLIALQAVLYIAVSFLPLPGAMGASESGFVRLFRTFFTAQTVVPAMLLSRAVSFYLMLLVSGACVAMMQLRNPDAYKKRLRILRGRGLHLSGAAE